MQASSEEQVLNSFAFLDKKNVKSEISLISIKGLNQSLRVTQGNISIDIQWSDLLGAKIENDIIWIVSAPVKMQRRMFSKKLNRILEQQQYKRVDSNEDLKEVQQIIQLFSRYHQTDLYFKKLQSNNRLDQLLIFVNPLSGKGQAMQIYQSVKDIFEISGLKCNVIQTEKRLHCYDYLLALSSEEILQYNGIIAVSGDGTIHEIVNAIMSREDKQRCLEELKVGGVHGGSGNAFQTTMCNLSGEPSTPESAAFLIVKNYCRHMDLMQFNRQVENINQDSNTHAILKSPQLYSFLSLSWTYVSDLDLGSENLRFLGEMRFEVYGLWRLLFLNQYPATLSYSETPEQLPTIEQSVPDSDQFKVLKNVPFTFFYLSNLPWVSEKYQSFPVAKMDDGKIDLIYLQGNQGKYQMIKTALALNDGSFFNKSTGEVAQGYNLSYSRISSIRLEPTNPERSGLYSIDGERYKAETLQGVVLPKILRVFSN